jgi:dolichyl-phosphate-mannose--protein O-mannosyl transferase
MSTLLHRFRAVILLSILSFAFFTRMFNLNNPETYIFDEVYHAVTAKLIAQNDPRAYEWWNPAPEPNTAVDWLHPPLAKYFQAASILAFGENSFGWRFSSVIFGVLVILMTYHLAYRLFNNSTIALLSAAIASLDGLLLVQSRIAMNDIHVTFFILFTLYTYLVYRQTNSIAKLFLTGCAAGLALASKWSGLFVLGSIGLFEVFSALKIFFIEYSNTEFLRKEWWFKVLRWIGLRVLILAIIPAVLYITGYTHMFLQGKGWAHLKELHNQIWWYQTHLDATHTYQSRPLEWFLNIRPVWMHVQYLDQARADIYAFGNPVLFLIGAATVFSTLIYFCLRTYEFFASTSRKTMQVFAKKILQHATTMVATNSLIFLTISYFAVWLPWQLSPRIMFFYHYTPAVPLLCILMSYWLYLVGKKQPFIYYLVLGTIALAFAVWYPHWVAIPVTTEFADAIYFALPQWK